MSVRPVRSSEASPPRIVVVDGEAEHEVFEVVEASIEISIDAPNEASGDVFRVRSPYLFEIGEELSIRIEQDGRTSDAIARVRAHTGPDDARITELEIIDPRSRIAGGGAPDASAGGAGDLPR
ncbi:MAG TPA: hypothetical protein VF469_07665, partial [Kofleriaceae bacterium]